MSVDEFRGQVRPIDFRQGRETSASSISFYLSEQLFVIHRPYFTDHTPNI